MAENTAPSSDAPPSPLVPVPAAVKAAATKPLPKVPFVAAVKDAASPPSSLIERATAAAQVLPVRPARLARLARVLPSFLVQPTPGQMAAGQLAQRLANNLNALLNAHDNAMAVAEEVIANAVASPEAAEVFARAGINPTQLQNAVNLFAAAMDEFAPTLPVPA